MKRRKTIESAPIKRRGSMKRRAEKYSDIRRCWMCKHYFVSPVYDKHHRVCIKTTKNVHDNEFACDDFAVALYFWCKQRAFCVDTEACISIRRKKYVDRDERILQVYRNCCLRACKQGAAIDALAAKYEVPKRPKIVIEKTSKLRRRSTAEVPTPKMMRRRNIAPQKSKLKRRKISK